MSWAEIFKINNNMKKTLNEQMREARFLPIRIITTTGKFTPEKTGIYKVICVGAGGDGYPSPTQVSAGGGGGVAIKTLRLLSTTSYNVTVNDAASSFAYNSTALTASSGEDGDKNESGGGGSASGGDSNYVGTSGAAMTYTSTVSPMAGSVGVYLSELTTIGKHEVFGTSGYFADLLYGESILGYGGGGTAVRFGSTPYYLAGLPGAVIIIPLEMEE
jgi:hypothetical protein